MARRTILEQVEEQQRQRTWSSVNQWVDTRESIIEHDLKTQ